MNITKLTKKQNNELETLLSDYANGAYWENEGWTVEHAAMLPVAERQLETWLNSLLKSYDT